MARNGKIARLPLAIREQLNRRLLEGETANKILPWLNALPEVAAVLQEDFEGLRVSDQNLSEWRQGGFAEWESRQARLAHTKELAHYAGKLASANSTSIAEGGAAIASGKLLELLEAVEDKIEPEALGEIINGLTSLRRVEVASAKVEVGRERLRQLEEALALEKEKFRRSTCELFIEWQTDARARDIAASPASYAEKIEKLGQTMWGELWKPQKPTP